MNALPSKVTNLDMNRGYQFAEGTKHEGVPGAIPTWFMGLELLLSFFDDIKCLKTIGARRRL
jgi:hypothetical protein